MCNPTPFLFLHCCCMQCDQYHQRHGVKLSSFIYFCKEKSTYSVFQALFLHTYSIFEFDCTIKRSVPLMVWHFDGRCFTRREGANQARRAANRARGEPSGEVDIPKRSCYLRSSPKEVVRLSIKVVEPVWG